MEQPKAFNLKSYMYHSTVFELTASDLASIENQIIATKKQAPKLFQNAASIIDFSKIDETVEDQFFINLQRLLEKHDFSVIGVCNPPRSLDTKSTHVFTSLSNAKSHKRPSLQDTIQTNAYIHSRNVRSGQQIIKKNADIVILGNVSPGSEIIAGGHIIVNGQLHGKAYAGINGNEESTVICQPCLPELISIASRYKQNPPLCDQKSKYIKFLFKENKIHCEEL